MDNKGNCYKFDNPVQELREQHLADIKKNLKHVEKVRKDIGKKRRETQENLMELEHKQIVYNAKHETALHQKEQSKNQMEYLGTQLENKLLKIEDIEKKIASLNKMRKKQKYVLPNQSGTHHDETVEGIRAKISEILVNIQGMIRHNSTQSYNRKNELHDDLERQRVKRLQAKVLLETLKDHENFVKETEDKQLVEKLKLEQKLYQLTNAEGKLKQEKQYQKKIIRREQENLENIVNDYLKLLNSGNDLTETYDKQKCLINKLIPELKCAKHDEKNLSEMLRESQGNVTAYKIDMETEIKLNNCFLTEIRKLEMDRGIDLFASSCQISSNCNDKNESNCLNISSPTLSTTYLDSRDSSRQEIDCSETSITECPSESENTSDLGCYEKLNIFSNRRQEPIPITTLQLSRTSLPSSFSDNESITSSSSCDNVKDILDGSTEAVYGGNSSTYLNSSTSSYHSGGNDC